MVKWLTVAVDRSYIMAKFIFLRKRWVQNPGTEKL